jgi:hypothetical protein
MFFKYGFRINRTLSKTNKEAHKAGRKEAPHSTRSSIGSLPIGLSGEFAPDSENLGGIKFDFANPIDTLNNGIKKTILLKSSQYSKKIGAPVEINLDIVAEETSPNHYIKSGNIPCTIAGRILSFHV